MISSRKDHCDIGHIIDGSVSFKDEWLVWITDIALEMS
jgi:hypothetical protein